MAILNLKLVIEINHHTNTMKYHEYNEMYKYTVGSNSRA